MSDENGRPSATETADRARDLACDALLELRFSQIPLEPGAVPVITAERAMGQAVHAALERKVEELTGRRPLLLDGGLEASTLRAKPGDVVLVRCPTKLSRDGLRAVREHVATALPGRRVLLLEAGLELDAVPPAELRAALVRAD